MEKLAGTALLLTALALPVALFLLLRARLRLNGLVAAGIAVATGWALNVAWAFVAANDPSQINGDTVACVASPDTGAG